MDCEDAREPGAQLPAHRRGNLVAVAHINLNPTNHQTKGYHKITKLNSTFDNAYIVPFMPNVTQSFLTLLIMGFITSHMAY